MFNQGPLCDVPLIQLEGPGSCASSLCEVQGETLTTKTFLCTVSSKTTAGGHIFG